MLSELLASELLYSIALTLFHFLWQGGVIAFALKIALTITPYQKSQARYALASLAMMLNLIIPLITFYFIFTRDANLNIALLDKITPLSQNTLPVINAHWVDSFALFSPYIALSWMTICGLLTLKLCIELYQVKHLSHANVIPPDNQLMQRFSTLVKQLKLTRVPRLVISLKTDVPMAIGVIKPIVLMPMSMISGLTPTQLDMLILHELAHIRRHDYLINIVQTLIETLLFFHPCCFWVSQQIRKEREYCCDDTAVTHCHDPIAYAHTLADTAAVCHLHRKHHIPKMAMAASGGDLKLRIVRLVKKEHTCTPSFYFPKGLAVLGILFMGICMGIQLNISVPVTQDIKHITNIDNITTNKTPVEASLVKKELQLVKYVQVSEPVPLDTKTLALLTQNNNAIKSNSVQGKSKSLLIENDMHNLQAPTLSSTSKRLTESSAHTVEEGLKLEVNGIAEKNVPKNKINIALTEQKKEIKESTQATQLTENDKTQNNIALTTIPPDSPTELVNALPILSKKALVGDEDITENPIKTLIVKGSKNTPQKLEPELIKAIEPRYPAAAQIRGLEQDVMVNFTVNTEGKVEDIEFKSHRKSQYFKSAIRSAMKKWRFLPAQQNGKPIESTMTKIFSFNLLT